MAPWLASQSFQTSVHTLHRKDLGGLSEVGPDIVWFQSAFGPNPAAAPPKASFVVSFCTAQVSIIVTTPDVERLMVDARWYRLVYACNAKNGVQRTPKTCACNSLWRPGAMIRSRLGPFDELLASVSGRASSGALTGRSFTLHSRTDARTRVGAGVPPSHADFPPGLDPFP